MGYSQGSSLELSFLTKKILQLPAHLFSPSFQVLEFISYVPRYIMKSHWLAVIHIEKLLAAFSGRYHCPCYQVRYKSYPENKEKHYHQQSYNYGVNVKIMSNTTINTNTYEMCCR